MENNQITEKDASASDTKRIVRRSCFNCKHLHSYQPDIVCYVECSLRDEIDYTFSNNLNPEDIASECEHFEDEDA